MEKNNYSKSNCRTYQSNFHILQKISGSLTFYYSLHVYYLTRTQGLQKFSKITTVEISGPIFNLILVNALKLILYMYVCSSDNNIQI